MTTALTYLALTALLTATLWVPYVIALTQTYGLPGPPQYTDPRTATNAGKPLPLWGVRANRAHLNAVEAFAPFAALVLVAHIAGKENATVAFCAMSFFWLRLVHAAVTLLGLPYIRTIIFTLGWIAELVIFWAIVS